MKLHFHKMTGAGNDFVVIDNRGGLITKGWELARKLCDRRWGIGADGLLMIENSHVASYKMMYFNADGSYGGMCGNGGRCIARYAAELGIARKEHRFEALDHIYGAKVHSSEITLEMRDPKDVRRDFVLRIGGKSLKASYVDTGAPHVVLDARGVSRRGLDQVDVVEIGKKIRYEKRFRPGGTNVNFVEISGHNSIRMRTYERGVEAETQACGTGAIAVAVVASARGMEPPINIETASNRILTVDFRMKDGEITGVLLSGPAETVFEGDIEV